MAVRNDREYRMTAEHFEVREAEGAESYIVEGYASTFEPYVLFEDEDGTQYREQIDIHAYDSADMNDVIFLYNHEGRVMARQKNHSLELGVDEHGLKVRADLSGSELGRGLYNDIKAGLIDQMSFAFTVSDEIYERATHTRIIRGFKKIYDVSAVSIPANPTTDIAARSWVNGAIEQERAERLKAEERAKLLEDINTKLEALKHENA